MAGTSYGRRWATIIFGSQVPLLALPGLTYQWFTGAFFGPVFLLGEGNSQLTFSVTVGANGQFFVDGRGTAIVFGLNLFAVLAVILLVRANKASKSAGGKAPPAA